MAKMNDKIVRIGTVKRAVKELKKEDVVEIDIGYAMFRCHRKFVVISLVNNEQLCLNLTWKEFREICYTLDFLNGEKLQYLC